MGHSEDQSTCVAPRGAEDPVLIDGATGTELERRWMADRARSKAGEPFPGGLWVATAVRDCPDLLEEIHRDYLSAGCNAITANTFRAQRYTFARNGRAADANAIVRETVVLARHVRDDESPTGLVLGSVGPLEDCYRPDLVPHADVCRTEHTWMIERLLDAEADVILIETMGSVREAATAAAVAHDLAPGRWMLSACLQSDAAEPVLLSGEPLLELVRKIDPMLDSIVAFGINCVAAPDVERHISRLQQLTGENLIRVAYANVSRLSRDGSWTATDADNPERYAGYAAQWRDLGVAWIGGCCGTTPHTMEAVAHKLKQRVCDSGYSD